MHSKGIYLSSEYKLIYSSFKFGFSIIIPQSEEIDSINNIHISLTLFGLEYSNS